MVFGSNFPIPNVDGEVLIKNIIEYFYFFWDTNTKNQAFSHSVTNKTVIFLAVQKTENLNSDKKLEGTYRNTVYRRFRIHNYICNLVLCPPVRWPPWPAIIRIFRPSAPSRPQSHRPAPYPEPWGSRRRWVCARQTGTWVFCTNIYMKMK